MLPAVTLAAVLTGGSLLLFLIMATELPETTHNRDTRTPPGASGKPDEEPSTKWMDTYAEPAKIAILTVAVGNQWFFNASIANKRAYADRHGYDVIVIDNLDTDIPPTLAVGDPEPPHPVWAKVSALRRHVRNYDWLWLLDADAFITNQNVRVEAFVSTVTRLHLAREPEPESPRGSWWTEWISGWLHPKDRRRVPGPAPPTLLPFPAVDHGPRVGPDIIVSMDCSGINAGSVLIRGARQPNPPTPATSSLPQKQPLQQQAQTIAPIDAAASPTPPPEPTPFPVQLADYWHATEPLPAFHFRKGMMEQASLAALIDANVLDARRRVAAVPLRVLNSYPQAFNYDCSNRDDPYSLRHERGDWVLHFVSDTKLGDGMKGTLRELGLME
ncbi:hypothetical protein DFJ73DRAFT_959641 [Zopfochytrium polystomum]|nr:hypothetical protein DFJ73DRAFT_959641 [Zopfochytrium polystomum]